MSFQSIIFELFLPFTLFFFIILSLLRKAQIFKEHFVEYGISFAISLLGAYWLYINKLSRIIVSSSGLVVVIIFVALVLISISLKGYSKIEESLKRKDGKEEKEK